MAQFDYLGTWEDSWAILVAIMAPGDVSLIPDLKYEEPQPQFFTAVDEPLKELLKRRPFLFIWSNVVSRYPPYLQRIEAGINTGRYSIDISRGGPGLSLSLPACYQEEGRMHLAPGMLSSQRLYLNPATGEWEPPPEELKAAYKAIMRRIKTRLVRHRFREEIWIGRDALREVQENKATIHGFGID